MSIIKQLEHWVDENCPEDIDGFTVNWEVSQTKTTFVLSASGNWLGVQPRFDRVIPIFQMAFDKEVSRLSGKQERAEQFRAALDRFVAEVEQIEGAV